MVGVMGLALQVRENQSEQKLLEKAASDKDLNLSDWARQTLIQAATR